MGGPFEHLPLVFRQRGPARLQSAPQTPSPDVTRNKADRGRHSAFLGAQSAQAVQFWQARQLQREQSGLPPVEGLPLLLRIDPPLDIDALRTSFDFEIISEEEDGFVIVASEDVSLATLQKKLTDFVGQVWGSGNVASLLDLREDPDQTERLRRIVSDRLLEEWPQMRDDSIYVCDVSVGCAGTWEVRKKPKRQARWSDEVWARREREWADERVKAYELWDELKEQRASSLKAFVHFYGGDILDEVDGAPVDAPSLPDSFTLRIRISAKGLKDLVLNSPHVFEVAEPDHIDLPQHAEREARAVEARLEFRPPSDDAPAVCVIDSGIQEAHFLLRPVIDEESSHCFVTGLSPDDVADYVSSGGHGTRVAGAVAYGESVPSTGIVEFDAWVQNARVLDANCGMPDQMFPPAVIREAILRYRRGPRRTRIFNHSINSKSPCRKVHMSSWAAEIDRLCHDDDILVIQSVGNLWMGSSSPNKGVREFVQEGREYPGYFDEPGCRVANPAQSLQALTVGSVGYGLFEDGAFRSFVGRPGEPSAFSRSGPGIWGTLKPDVVDYGGDFLRVGKETVATPAVGRSCYPELVRSTLYSGPSIDRDGVGTSFAAPKVARIAARLQATLPEESCLLYRALIAQSARWPDWAEGLSRQQQADLLKRIGYGVPDIDRACQNTDFRVTLISEGERLISPGECHIFQVPVPEEIRRSGFDYPIRIEVTLSYVAQPRRTRRSIRGYLSCWVDWMSNRRGESREAFSSRTLKEAEDVIGEGSSIPWKIGANPKWGQLPDASRTRSTLQKDWTVLRSYELPEDFCIAVRGHKGWSRDPDVAARYALVVSFESLGEELSVYESIRASVIELQELVKIEEGLIEVEIGGA